MHKNLLSAAVIAVLTLTAPFGVHAEAAPAAAALSNPSSELARLFAASDEGSLKRNPLQALFRGDMRYADQFGDYISDEYLAGERAAAKADLAGLAAIDRSRLSADEQLSYDVFKWQRRLDLEGLEAPIVQLNAMRPIDHFNGLHAMVPDLFSGQSIAPFKTVKDYEDNLKRLDGFTVAMDRSLARMKEGVAAGVVQPKIVSERVLGQLDRFVAAGVDGSTLMMPVQKFPEGISAADQARLTAAYRDKIANQVMPSYVRMRDYVRDSYLPASRGNEQPGLITMPRGNKLYAYLVKTQTTTNMTPDEIHALGLAEVARIKSGMDTIRRKVGYQGDLRSFFEYLRNDPQFKPASKEALTQGYYDIGKRVDVSIPKLFRTVPKSPLEIRPVPEYLEKDQAGGYYNAGTPDGTRPGVFYFNTYDLPSRTTPGMETLYLHEGVPGHHFQIALAQENTALPPFQRFGGNTAFVEGWALYAESLGEELGMLSDPYQRFGGYDDEMLRAMRLVVDTGLHHKGWSRQQAIDYMLANSSQSKTDATNEVDRYIAMPAQALAYKVGQIRIRQARIRAEQALGPKFDIKAFHEQVLMSGALPLEILDQKVDRWIAAQKG